MRRRRLQDESSASSLSDQAVACLLPLNEHDVEIKPGEIAAF
jgi:hypothetical protein